MPKPRKAQVSLEATPYYHVVSRCVRRTFLCGLDHESGQDFEHRRQWIEDRIFELAEVFALDVAAYAVMSNHYHLVLYINRDLAMEWNEEEVIERWHRLFGGCLLSQRYRLDEPLSSAERSKLSEVVAEWRSRLMDLSWYMRCLNEPIARQANREDGCTGHFWEGRFKSQALLDEKALAAAMAYVDLNPIRAGMAETPEASEHTSVRERIREVLAGPEDTKKTERLLPFVGYPREPMPKGLPFRLSDYLELVDWTGRQLREDKHGMIAEELPPILGRLGIDPGHWLHMARHFEGRFKSLVGCAYRLKRACRKLGYRRTPGLGACQALLT